DALPTFAALRPPHGANRALGMQLDGSDPGGQFSLADAFRQANEHPLEPAPAGQRVILRVHLVHAINERPLFVVQPHRLTTQVARAMNQVALNEVAHLRPKRRPILVAVVRHHEYRHATSPPAEAPAGHQPATAAVPPPQAGAASSARPPRPWQSPSATAPGPPETDRSELLEAGSPAAALCAPLRSPPCGSRRQGPQAGPSRRRPSPGTRWPSATATPAAT